MKSASILLVLAVFTGVARGAPEGGCGRAGALRCDADGRHVSACTKGGAWRRVLDCGASRGACVDGRCVPQVSSNATRAEECTPNTWGCKECKIRQYCSAGGNWIDIGNCGDNEVCICGKCEPDVTNKCDSLLMCSATAAGKRFPNPSDCKKYLICDTEWTAPLPESCTPNKNFDPCKGDCYDNSVCWENQPCDSNNNGQFNVVLGNPSLYYFCLDGTTIFFSCEADKIFYPSKEECLTPAVSCPANTAFTERQKYSIKKHVSYDDCSSNGSDTSGCIPGEKWPADNECQYYFCVSSIDSRLMTCPVNTKFDATAKNCVVSSGSCT